MAVYVNDLEYRDRRKNVWTFGLQEDMEGSNPTKFFNSWIANFLGVETKANCVEIEQICRSQVRTKNSDHHLS